VLGKSCRKVVFLIMVAGHQEDRHRQRREEFFREPITSRIAIIGNISCDDHYVRGWLQKNYKTLALRYVLLVGNPDPGSRGVPMKNTYAFANHASYPTITPRPGN